MKKVLMLALGLTIISLGVAKAQEEGTKKEKPKPKKKATRKKSSTKKSTNKIQVE